jgi:hypothetical protein
MSPAFSSLWRTAARTIADAAEYISEKILLSYALHGFGSYRIDLRKQKQRSICGLVKGNAEARMGFLFSRFSGMSSI